MTATENINTLRAYEVRENLTVSEFTYDDLENVYFSYTYKNNNKIICFNAELFCQKLKEYYFITGYGIYDNEMTVNYIRNDEQFVYDQKKSVPRKITETLNEYLSSFSTFMQETFLISYIIQNQK